VRLCLDEHYSPDIAGELRARGYDAVSVKERPELVGVSDRPLFEMMAAEQRALLTENVADFMPLLKERAARNERHGGLIFSSPQSLPRSKNTIGLYVDALEVVLRTYPGENDFEDMIHWLGPN
jgi:hypothetical protein